MNNKDFEVLKERIKRKMNELSYLQDIHIRETGACCIPGGIKARTLEDKGLKAYENKPIFTTEQQYFIERAVGLIEDSLHYEKGTDPKVLATWLSVAGSYCEGVAEVLRESIKEAGLNHIPGTKGD